MATFSLGYIEQRGRVKYFGDKFNVLFNNESFPNPGPTPPPNPGPTPLPNPGPTPPPRPAPYVHPLAYLLEIGEDISIDEYSERLYNDLDAKKLSDQQYDVMIALLENDWLNYELNFHLVVNERRPLQECL
jgi:hypothetical protein